MIDDRKAITIESDFQLFAEFKSRLKSTAS